MFKTAVVARWELFNAALVRIYCRRHWTRVCLLDALQELIPADADALWPRARSFWVSYRRQQKDEHNLVRGKG